MNIIFTLRLGKEFPSLFLLFKYKELVRSNICEVIIMKIAINAGHTLRGRGTGAVGYLNEMKENRKIAQRVTQLLKEVGYFCKSKSIFYNTL